MTATISASNERRMSSRLKKTPATGALNVAEMPADAPQATSSRMRRSETAANRPTRDPSAEPICTIGPSRPTEPPDPMHSADANDFTTPTAGSMRPPAAPLQP